MNPNKGKITITVNIKKDVDVCIEYIILDASFDHLFGTEYKIDIEVENVSLAENAKNLSDDEKFLAIDEAYYQFDNKTLEELIDNLYYEPAKGTVCYDMLYNKKHMYKD